MIANLDIELDGMDDEINALISARKKTFSWEYIGFFDWETAEEVTDNVVSVIFKHLKIITKDYGILLEEKDIISIEQRIEANKQKILKELDFINMEPTDEREYIKQGVERCIVSEDEARQAHEKTLQLFQKRVELQKMRLKNFYRRESKNRRISRIRTWTPIIISTIASVISITISIISLCISYGSK